MGAIVALAVAGCGGSAAAPPAAPHAKRVAVVDHATPPAPAPAPPAPAPQPPAAAPLSPALSALQLALTRQLGRAGAATGAYVFDLTNGRVLFALRDGVRRPPASVEKLYTSIAVLRELGAGVTLQTAVLGAGFLGNHGIWHGDLYVRGGGDPTFGDAAFNRNWEQGYGPTAAQLVTQLQHLGIRRVTGKVIGDAALFDGRRGVPSSGFAPDVPDLGGQLAALTYDHGATAGRSPGAFAANELVLTMRASGIKASSLRRTLPAPPGARVLATVTSPPASVLLRLMNVPSDDFFAEMLTKQLGARVGGAGTTAAGAGAIESVAAGYGIHPAIVDGSGLSRSDLSSPAEVVALLRAVWRSPDGSVLWDSLPTVGVSGTVRTVGTHTPARGRCVAKTGTLDNVSNLAGYCHARGHDVLAFALFVDGPSNWSAFKLISKMVGAIAAY